MAYTHDEGELLILNSAFSGREVEIGLFDNTTDAIAEGDSYSAISTEPDGVDYAVQSVTDPTVSQDAGTTSVDIGALSYNVSDATTSVNYAYVRDATSGDLIFTNELEQAYDLNSVDTLDLVDIGVELD